MNSRFHFQRCWPSFLFRLGVPWQQRGKERRYLATVAKGEATSLQGDKSDVKLEIKEGCPKRAYLMEVRTDLSKFESFIPDDECFISPIVEVLGPAETNTSAFLLRIPHCLDKDDDRTKVKVRMIHENRNPAVVEVPKGNAGALYYDIDWQIHRAAHHTLLFGQFVPTVTDHSTAWVESTVCGTPSLRPNFRRPPPPPPWMLTPFTMLRSDLISAASFKLLWISVR